MIGTDNRPECKCRVSWQGGLTERGIHEHGGRGPGTFLSLGHLKIVDSSTSGSPAGSRYLCIGPQLFLEASSVPQRA